jgi:hypothetical protein
MHDRDAPYSRLSETQNLVSIPYICRIAETHLEQWRLSPNHNIHGRADHVDDAMNHACGSKQAPFRIARTEHVCFESTHMTQRFVCVHIRD